MKNTFYTPLLTITVIASLLLNTACHSPRFTKNRAANTNSLDNELLAQQYEASQSDVSHFESAGQLAASTSSNLSDLPAAAATNTSLSASGKEIDSAPDTAAMPEKKQAKGNKLKAATTRLLLKTTLKKAEKAQKRFDAKKEKAAKASKALDPEVRTGILIAALGVLLLLIGLAISSGLIYALGGIGLTVGLVVIILAALDVI